MELNKINGCFYQASDASSLLYVVAAAQGAIILQDYQYIALVDLACSALHASPSFLFKASRSIRIATARSARASA